MNQVKRKGAWLARWRWPLAGDPGSSETSSQRPQRPRSPCTACFVKRRSGSSVTNRRQLRINDHDVELSSTHMESRRGLEPAPDRGGNSGADFILQIQRCTRERLHFLDLGSRALGAHLHGVPRVTGRWAAIATKNRCAGGSARRGLDGWSTRIALVRPRRRGSRRRRHTLRLGGCHVRCKRAHLLLAPGTALGTARAQTWSACLGMGKAPDQR